MINVGQIVFSKKGRDRGIAFIIYQVKDEYVYLVNGDSRRLEKPKKKKIKHIQKTNTIVKEIKDIIEGNNKTVLKDSDIRKAIMSNGY